MPDVNMPDMRSPDSPTAPSSKPSHNPSRHVLPWVILAILLVAAAGSVGAWWLMGRAPKQALAAAPMKVPVMTMVARTVPVYRSFPAVTQAMRIVTIQARVTGYLAEQGAVDGADVASGALLYRVDAKDYQAAFAQARRCSTKPVPA